MKKRIIITTIIVAVVHFAVMFNMMIVAAGSIVKNLGDADYEPPTKFEQIAESTSEILMQPGYSLWTPWMGKNLPDFIEWIFVIGNSLLWGFAIAMLINCRKLLKRQKA